VLPWIHRLIHMFIRCYCFIIDQELTHRICSDFILDVIVLLCWASKIDVCWGTGDIIIARLVLLVCGTVTVGWYRN